MRKNWKFFAITISIVLIYTFALIYAHDIRVDNEKNSQKELKAAVRYMIEESYYRGQTDAIKGDIRIIEVKDTTNNTTKWVWLKSPWNNGRQPSFKP